MTRRNQFHFGVYDLSPHPVKSGVIGVMVYPQGCHCSTPHVTKGLAPLDRELPLEAAESDSRGECV